MLIQNFGKNVKFAPKHYYEPKNESEVMQILKDHAHGSIRVIGGGHAWSHAIESNDCLLNLKHINSIDIKIQNGFFGLTLMSLVMKIF